MQIFTRYSWKLPCCHLLPPAQSETVGNTGLQEVLPNVDNTHRRPMVSDRAPHAGSGGWGQVDSSSKMSTNAQTSRTPGYKDYKQAIYPEGRGTQTTSNCFIQATAAIQRSRYKKLNPHYIAIPLGYMQGNLTPLSGLQAAKLLRCRPLGP